MRRIVITEQQAENYRLNAFNCLSAKKEEEHVLRKNLKLLLKDRKAIKKEISRCKDNYSLSLYSGVNKENEIANLIREKSRVVASKESLEKKMTLLHNDPSVQEEYNSLTPVYDSDIKRYEDEILRLEHGVNSDSHSYFESLEQLRLNGIYVKTTRYNLKCNLKSQKAIIKRIKFIDKKVNKGKVDERKLVLK